MSHLTFDEWVLLWRKSGMFCRPLWVRDGPLDIYVKCHHMMGNVVGIGNITNKRTLKGKGALGRFLDRVDSKVPLAFTEVLNLRLAQHLINRGWYGVYNPDHYSIPCIASPLAMEEAGERLKSLTYLRPLDNVIITTQIANYHDAVFAQYGAQA